LPRLSTTVTFTEGVICDAAEEVLLGCVLKLIDKLLATLMEKEAFADCCGELESTALTAKENRPIEVRRTVEDACCAESYSWRKLSAGQRPRNRWIAARRGQRLVVRCTKQNTGQAPEGVLISRGAATRMLSAMERHLSRTR